MVLYLPNFSLVFLIHVFLYAGVYCISGKIHPPPPTDGKLEILVGGGLIALLTAPWQSYKKNCLSSFRCNTGFGTKQLDPSSAVSGFFKRAQMES